MNTSPGPLPTPMEINLHPELSIVALLHHTINLTTCSLLAAHPELSECDLPPWWVPPAPATLLSRYLLKQLDLLAELLPEYKIAVLEPYRPAHRAGPTDAQPF